MGSSVLTNLVGGSAGCVFAIGIDPSPRTEAAPREPRGVEAWGREQ
jgi:hypothetical protein